LRHSRHGKLHPLKFNLTVEIGIAPLLCLNTTYRQRFEEVTIGSFPDSREPISETPPIGHTSSDAHNPSHVDILHRYPLRQWCFRASLAFRAPTTKDSVSGVNSMLKVSRSSSLSFVLPVYLQYHAQNQA
jgi:hypothetical protein